MSKRTYKVTIQTRLHTDGFAYPMVVAGPSWTRIGLGIGWMPSREAAFEAVCRALSVRHRGHTYEFTHTHKEG